MMVVVLTFACMRLGFFFGRKHENLTRIQNSSTRSGDGAQARANASDMRKSTSVSGQASKSILMKAAHNQLHLSLVFLLERENRRRMQVCIEVCAPLGQAATRRALTRRRACGPFARPWGRALGHCLVSSRSCRMSRLCRTPAFACTPAMPMSAALAAQGTTVRSD